MTSVTVLAIVDLEAQPQAVLKVEKDPFYQDGIKKGIEKGIEQGQAGKSHTVVENLIIKLGLSDEQAADVAEVSVSFVKEVRKELDAKK